MHLIKAGCEFVASCFVLNRITGDDQFRRAVTENCQQSIAVSSFCGVIKCAGGSVRGSERFRSARSLLRFLATSRERNDRGDRNKNDVPRIGLHIGKPEACHSNSSIAPIDSFEIFVFWLHENSRRRLTTSPPSPICAPTQTLAPARTLSTPPARPRQCVGTRWLSSRSIRCLRPLIAASFVCTGPSARCRCRSLSGGSARTITWCSWQRARIPCVGAIAWAHRLSARNPWVGTIAWCRQSCRRRTIGWIGRATVSGIGWRTITRVAGRAITGVTRRAIPASVVSATPVAIPDVDVAIVNDRVAMPTCSPIPPAPPTATTADHRADGNARSEGNNRRSCYVGGSVLRDHNRRAINDGWVVRGHVHYLRIGRLNDDRLWTLLDHLDLRTRFQISCRMGFCSHSLDGLHHILLLCGRSFTK